MGTDVEPSGNAHVAEKKGWVIENMGALYRAGENKIRPGVYRRFEKSSVRNSNSITQSASEEKYSHITLIDTGNPSNRYKLAVENGKLTMSQNAPDGERSQIILKDTGNPSNRYKLAVENGKLTMSQSASRGESSHITLIDTGYFSDRYKLAVENGKLTMERW